MSSSGAILENENDESYEDMPALIPCEDIPFETSIFKINK